MIDIDTPDDPTTSVLLQLRVAGSEGDSDWFSATLVNSATRCASTPAACLKATTNTAR